MSDNQSDAVNSLVSDASPERAERPGSDPGSLLVFRLANHEHALPVERVVEIVRMVAVTPVSEGPSWLAGVISLRGRVVPVIDLRARFELGRAQVGLETPLVIVEAGELAAGLIVDAVKDVLSLPAPSLAAPDSSVGSTQSIVAVAALGERLIQVLDAEALLAGSRSFMEGRT